MRVVFVDNLLFEDAEGIRRYVLQPHLGLITLIAVIERSGHEGLLYDPKVEVTRGTLRLDDSLYRDMAFAIHRMRPDVVGFTSLGCNFICTAKVAAYLKQLEPDLPILLGGPHATVLDAEILEACPQFDAIVRGEAERTIGAVLDAVRSRAFDRLPGVSFMREGRLVRNVGDAAIADLDELPLPAYAKYPVRELNLTSLRVDAGRGCPFQCTFCSTAAFFGRKYRLKSSSRLVHELDSLNEIYGITDFALTHDLFTVNRRKVLQFCDAVESRGYTWKCSARVDCVDDELLERMASAGCRSIYYGIEAGSERMQKISKKRLDLNLLDPILASTQRVGMSATLSFITGYPEEEKADQDASLDLLGKHFARDRTPLNLQLHLLTPEPGTELLNQYRDGILYDEHVSDFNFPALESDDSAYIARNPRVFVNHHYFPSRLPRRRHIFVTTAWQALYGLGFPVLRYILRRFDGKLSRLVEAMDRWAQHAQRPAQCDPQTIEDFFESRFGSAHHLSGLVRYMLRAAELRRRATLPQSSREAPAADASSLPLRLSDRAFVLKRVPDCPEILRRLTGAKDIPDGELIRKRYDFLVYLPPSQPDVVRNFRLSDASRTFLEYLRVSRLRAECETGFEESSGFPAPPREFVDTLTHWGVVEPVADELRTS